MEGTTQIQEVTFAKKSLMKAALRILDLSGADYCILDKRQNPDKSWYLKIELCIPMEVST